MKKLLFLVVGLLMTFGLGACAKEKDVPLEGTLEEMLDKIYENGEYESDFKEYILPSLGVIKINAENVNYFLGTEIEFEDAIASESNWTSRAYSVCLVKVKAGANVTKIKKDILENVDSYKWICVGVEKEDIIVDNIGDVIILIMTDFQAEAIHNAFLSLKTEK